MIVTLSQHEVFQAATAGVLRQMEALKNGRADAHRFDRDPWGTHIAGAFGELVVAKATGTYWTAVYSVADLASIEGDVGRLQIRTTAKTDGHLFTYPRDNDEATFVLVVGTAPTFRIVGSILGGATKRQEWWREPGDGKTPAARAEGWRTPQSELDPWPA